METMTSFAADRVRRTAQVDRWLAELLGAEPSVALVAVGGYGRRELLPRSDLDVVLLHAGRDDIAGIAAGTWSPAGPWGPWAVTGAGTCGPAPTWRGCNGTPGPTTPPPWRPDLVPGLGFR